MAKPSASCAITACPPPCLLTSFYWDNLIHFGMGPKAGPDGRLAITFPMGDGPLPGIAAEAIGKWALGRPPLSGRAARGVSRFRFPRRG